MQGCFLNIINRFSNAYEQLWQKAENTTVAEVFRNYVPKAGCAVGVAGLLALAKVSIFAAISAKVASCAVIIGVISLFILLRRPATDAQSTALVSNDSTFSRGRRESQQTRGQEVRSQSEGRNISLNQENHVDSLQIPSENSQVQHVLTQSTSPSSTENLVERNQQERVTPETSEESTPTPTKEIQDKGELVTPEISENLIYSQQISSNNAQVQKSLSESQEPPLLTRSTASSSNETRDTIEKTTVTATLVINEPVELLRSITTSNELNHKIIAAVRTTLFERVRWRSKNKDIKDLEALMSVFKAVVADRVRILSWDENTPTYNSFTLRFEHSYKYEVPDNEVQKKSQKLKAVSIILPEVLIVQFKDTQIEEGLYRKEVHFPNPKDTTFQIISKSNFGISMTNTSRLRALYLEPDGIHIEHDLDIPTLIKSFASSILTPRGTVEGVLTKAKSVEWVEIQKPTTAKKGK